MTNDISVRKTIVVDAPQDQAFAVFCRHMGSWWPLDYHIGKQDAVDVVIEPAPGGRWYETAADGAECDWGRVLEWVPPEQIVLSWQISPSWEPDSSIVSEVEVRFVADGATRTRVELEHRNLATFGEDSETMRGIFDSESGWTGLLARFTTAVLGGS